MHGDSAPRYPVPDLSVVAVEHPYALDDLDDALRSFGRAQRFGSVSFIQFLN